MRKPLNDVRPTLRYVRLLMMFAVRREMEYPLPVPHQRYWVSVQLQRTFSLHIRRINQLANDSHTETIAPECLSPVPL